VALYKWRCDIAADLTYHPPDDLPGTRVLFQRYHNSHVRLDALPVIDCFGVIDPLDRDRLWPGEAGAVRIHLSIPTDAGPWMESALHVGKGFTIDEFGYFIASGTVTALQHPLTPITPRPV
jgi:hypothetical protein